MTVDTPITYKSERLNQDRIEAEREADAYGLTGKRRKDFIARQEYTAFLTRAFGPMCEAAGGSVDVGHILAT